MFDPNIPDISRYNVEMRKSMIDKLFFLDKVDVDGFLDYGCADGTLLEFIKNALPETKMIGYDISEEMIDLAKEKIPSVDFSSNWSYCWSEAQQYKSVGLVLSSIIHEVYSYSSEKEIEQFWNRVWQSGFEYVIIRDMMVGRSTSRPADPISVAKIRQNYPVVRLNEWEEQWGSLNENWSLVHFLLTYRYKVNWAREYVENYLPINYETLLTKVPAEYEPVFIEHYTLPFLRGEVQKDFGIDLQDRTHIKLIFRRK